MDRNAVREKIIAIALEEFPERTNLKRLKDGDKLEDTHGFDSLDMIELMIQVEESLGIRLTEKDVDPENLKTFGDIVDLCYRKVKRKGNAGRKR